MATNPNLLLYIEPQNPKSEKPIFDELTSKMEKALVLAQEGTANYNQTKGKVNFNQGGAYRGFHICSCGEISTNCDYLLHNGEITNSLASHYMAYHRDEIPEDQIERVKKL